MYKFTYSEEKNRIHIFVEGELSPSEVDNYIKDMISLIEKTRPGFTVLTDTSQAEISFLETSPKFQVIRDYGVKKGFKNCATIMRADVYKIHQMQPFPGVVNTFMCIQAAEAFLDNLI